MTSAFDLASKQIGLNETDAALKDYLTTGGQNIDPEMTAWCAAYINGTLAQSGQQGTGSNMARSFENWGVATNEPQRGDIAVFSRGDPNSGQGHVGFFEGYNPDGTIRVLGGNQSDAVGISSYDPSRLLSFRRGADQPASPDNPGGYSTGEPAVYEPDVFDNLYGKVQDSGFGQALGLKEDGFQKGSLGRSLAMGLLGSIG